MRDSTAPKLLDNSLVKEVAEKLGKSTGQVLIRWALQRGTVVIPKSTNPARIEQNLAVLDWEIPAEEFKQLSSLEHQQRYMDGSFFTGPDKPFKTTNDLWDE